VTVKQIYRRKNLDQRLRITAYPKTSHRLMVLRVMKVLNLLAWILLYQLLEKEKV